MTIIHQPEDFGVAGEGEEMGGLTELFRSIYVLSLFSSALCITYLQEFGKQYDDVVIGDNVSIFIMQSHK